MTWVFADDADNAFAADNAAKFAERLNGGTDSHGECSSGGERLINNPPGKRGREA
jgi:hypothetical protein